MNTDDIIEINYHMDLPIYKVHFITYMYVRRMFYSTQVRERMLRINSHFCCHHNFLFEQKSFLIQFSDTMGAILILIVIIRIIVPNKIN